MPKIIDHEELNTKVSELRAKGLCFQAICKLLNVSYVTIKKWYKGWSPRRFSANTKRKIVKMHLEGYSGGKIGVKLGCSRQYVHCILKKVKREKNERL